jgi:hypothetical protein
MNGILDFYMAIAIFAAYTFPLLVVAWALETWWMRLPRYKRNRILRKMGVK